MKLNKSLLILVSCSLILSQNAFAARFGGGKSYGMQRNTTSYSSQNRSYQQQPSQQYQQNNTRPRMGAGTAAMLGAAAGAAGGYMLGRNSNNNTINASGTQSAAPSEMGSNNIPWGMIGILAVLLCLGLIFFRKSKANPGLFGNSDGMNNSNNFNNNQTMNRTNAAVNTAPSSKLFGFKAAAPTPTNLMDKMPDGIEAMYFLRQVKGMFLHIQSMNNKENVSEIQKYMTDGLYQEMKSSVSENAFVADFSNLDCQLLNAEMVNQQLVASVKFFGMVSDEPEQASQPFAETWNFVKTNLTSTGKWLVAGIQQEDLNK